jgi:predicted dehydrogenase/threonine dehydrogenase-like Zn-dependent dehydrogenase
MLVEFGKANIIDKARQQPDKVRMVLDKIRTDGLAPTLEAVRSKLEQPLPMGYCNVGTVLEVGAGVTGFSAGDRIASNGKHAEVVCVPANLCAAIPEEVTDEAAAFTVIGSIALQGIRLIQPTLGEVVVVTGLGLIGLMAVQLLRAHGCRVLGIDFDSSKLALARSFGAETVDLSRGEDPLAAARAISRSRGVDAAIITASTKSNEPVHQAALMCRKRGRIVLVGVVGLELSRADFYEKELSFQVSCSYGPGRYDPLYEERGQDYPIGFVRWTERRNFEALLDMLAEGRVDVAPLISHRFPLAAAQQAYDVLKCGTALGILLTYPEQAQKSDEELRRRSINLRTVPGSASPQAGPATVGFIGSGNYSSRVLIPAFAATPAVLKTIACGTGVSGTYTGRKYGFAESTTDTERIFTDPAITVVVIATRHDSHARLVRRALQAGKHVFVEKPLALTTEELDEIKDIYQQLAASGRPPLLMVGFNRRFAPQVVRMKALLAAVREPKNFIMTVNAGDIPAEHWTQDRSAGGGRVIGEGCHFIDLLRFLAAAPITGYQAAGLGNAAQGALCNDKVTITLTFADGSCGTVHYLANGHKSFPKERLEVFCGGRIVQLDNFRRMGGFGWPRFTNLNLWRQDKGNSACVAAFVKAVSDGLPSPIPFDELMDVSTKTVEIAHSLEK